VSGPAQTGPDTVVRPTDRVPGPNSDRRELSQAPETVHRSPANAPDAAATPQCGPVTTTTNSREQSPRDERVSLSDPGQLIAAIPHLLGFRPADSVVVIGHRGPAGRAVGAVMRADLPPPGYERDLAGRLLPALLDDGAIGATVVIVGGAPPGPAADPPGATLVGTIREVLGQVRLQLLHALRTPEIRSGARWSCFSDSTCTGELPDPACTVLAAASATAGAVTFGSREALARLLDPVDAGTLRRRSVSLDSAADAGGDHPDSDSAVREACAHVRATLRRFRRGEPALADDEVVRLALALSHSRVRDACLATALPAGTEHARVAERLWLALVRATPAPERAQAACLLGYSAYMRGDGALAAMALDNALEADPGHVLAGLLWRAVDRGMLPKRLAQLGRCDDEASVWLSGNGVRPGHHGGPG